MVLFFVKHSIIFETADWWCAQRSVSDVWLDRSFIVRPVCTVHTITSRIIIQLPSITAFLIAVSPHEESLNDTNMHATIQRVVATILLVTFVPRLIAEDITIASPVVSDVIAFDVAIDPRFDHEKVALSIGDDSIVINASDLDSTGGQFSQRIVTSSRKLEQVRNVVAYFFLYLLLLANSSRWISFSFKWFSKLDLYQRW